MPDIARIGDPGSHGGTIVTGSPNVSAVGPMVARIGDIYDCAIHGPNPIATGSTSVKANGIFVALVGSTTQCGATITRGAPTVITS